MPPAPATGRATAPEGGDVSAGASAAAAPAPPPVLEIPVDDLDAAVPLAIAAGATLAQRVRYGLASKSAMLHLPALPTLALALVERAPMR